MIILKEKLVFSDKVPLGEIWFLSFKNLILKEERTMRRMRTQKQINQFKRFQTKGTLTAMLGQAIRLMGEDIFSKSQRIDLNIIKARCKMCLEKMEEGK